MMKKKMINIFVKVFNYCLLIFIFSILNYLKFNIKDIYSYNVQIEQYLS